MVSPKWQNATRITPPVVSVARELFEPSWQKDRHARCACLRTHLALKYRYKYREASILSSLHVS